MQKVNVVEIIKEETAGHREKSAVIQGDDAYSYAEIFSAVERAKNILEENGVKRFHRIGFVCSNSTDFIVVSLAILSIGAVIVPLSPDHTQNEMEETFDGIAVDFIIFLDGLFNAQKDELFSFNCVNKIFYILKRVQGNVEIPDDYFSLNPAFIRFSSGTTGKSKGVVLSHESIIERTDEANKGLQIERDDSILWVLSMSFHFVVTILLFLRRASTIIICNTPLESSLSLALSKKRATVIYSSPYHYNIICNSSQISCDSFNGIRLAVSTTMKLPRKIADDFKEKFDFNLTEAYGIIEVGLPFINFQDSCSNLNSVGRALPGYKLRIDNADKSGVGEILIKGKGMLDAYFLPWRTRKEILHDGWFRTEDLGYQDKDLNLVLVGRNNNVIVFMGMKIFPQEVEAILNSHHSIEESYLYGEKHARFNQLPVAKIVLKKGMKGELDIEELRHYCYKQLARYKVPKSFEVVAEIPKTKSGKIKIH